MRFFLLIFFALFANSAFSQQWKEMANDININIYDVVAEAEAYFEAIDKTKKGSGWKAYQRWLYENEPKYYPSGERNIVKSNFVSDGFKDFLVKKGLITTLRITRGDAIDGACGQLVGKLTKSVKGKNKKNSINLIDTL